MKEAEAGDNTLNGTQPSAAASGSAAPIPPDEDDHEIDWEMGPSCGMCGDYGWIMLSDAGPSGWGEDCFCEVDRPIECPECRDRRRYEAQQAKRQNAPAHRPEREQPKTRYAN